MSSKTRAIDQKGKVEMQMDHTRNDRKVNRISTAAKQAVLTAYEHRLLSVDQAQSIIDRFHLWEA